MAQERGEAERIRRMKELIDQLASSIMEAPKGKLTIDFAGEHIVAQVTHYHEAQSKH